jgi:hypothetical protein
VACRYFNFVMGQHATRVARYIICGKFQHIGI